MVARILDNGTVSKTLVITNGENRDCVCVPILFPLVFSAMIMHAYRDERRGICIAYRTGSHLNSRRMHVSTCLLTTTAHYLLFADDCALNTETEADMQRSMELSVSGCAKFRLTINTDETVVIHRSPPSAAYIAPRVHANDTRLETVDTFAYFGSTLTLH
nr:unnamed protein product [Spirometra erinaceieuropaei]